MIDPIMAFQRSNTMKTYEGKSPCKSAIVTSNVVIAVSCGKHSLEE
jgi:hypothetical protein